MQKRSWQSDERNEASTKRVRLELAGLGAPLEAHKDTSLIICFDLELTYGSFASEIFQIGARGGEKEFKCYILPRGPIDWGVTKFVNGIKVAKDNNGGGGRRLV